MPSIPTSGAPDAAITLTQLLDIFDNQDVDGAERYALAIADKPREAEAFSALFTATIWNGEADENGKREAKWPFAQESGGLFVTYFAIAEKLARVFELSGHDPDEYPNWLDFEVLDTGVTRITTGWYREGAVEGTTDTVEMSRTEHTLANPVMAFASLIVLFDNMSYRIGARDTDPEVEA